MYLCMYLCVFSCNASNDSIYLSVCGRRVSYCTLHNNNSLSIKLLLIHSKYNILLIGDYGPE